MATSREKIISKAVELIEAELNGVRYSELVTRIHEGFPDIPINTIHGTIWNLDIRTPDKVYKPARGLFRHTSFKEVSETEPAILPITELKSGNLL